MTVLIKEPGELPRLTTIKNELKNVQDLVGGYIEVVTWCSDGLVFICNEEGKRLGFPVNFKVTKGNEVIDYVTGTAIFCGTDGEEFCDITRSDRLLDLFAELSEDKLEVRFE